MQWQTDLAVSFVKRAQVETYVQKTLLKDALTILQKLHNAHRLDHEKQGWIRDIENALLEIAAGDVEAEE